MEVPTAEALGAALVKILPSAVGSFISLSFFEKLSTRERWATFFGGCAMGYWLGGPITIISELKPGIEPGINLLVGLFGMSLAAKIIQVIRDTDWIGFARNIIKAIRGGGEGK